MPAIERKQFNTILPIVFAIEASDNMVGEYIATINEVMLEGKEILTDVAVGYPDTEIRVAVVKYGDTAELLTSGFEFLEQFEWTDVATGGKANLGKAIELIDKKLLRKAVITNNTGTPAYCKPILLFISSLPSSDDYMSSLANADKNANFHFARKIGIAIGNGCGRDMLVNITGTPEAVVMANDLVALRSLIIACEMPEPDEIEDFLYEKTVSESTKETSPIVKVDGIESRDNFYLEDSYGLSVSIMGSTDIVRCQCGPCEPENANDIMFHIEDGTEYLKLTNSENLDNLYVSFYVGSKDERIIVGCCKSIFAIIPASGYKLDSYTFFEINDNGIKISNNSSGAVYFKAIVDAGMCAHLKNRDIIQNGNDDLFTVLNFNADEIIDGDIGEVIIGGDIGGWE